MAKDPDSKALPKITWAMIQKGIDRKNQSLISKIKDMKALLKKALLLNRKLINEVDELKKKDAKLKAYSVMALKLNAASNKSILHNYHAGN